MNESKGLASVDENVPIAVPLGLGVCEFGPEIGPFALDDGRDGFRHVGADGEPLLAVKGLELDVDRTKRRALFKVDALRARWEQLSALRERVLAQIEPMRKEKQIGSSLQARVVVRAEGARGGLQDAASREEFRAGAEVRGEHHLGDHAGVGGADRQRSA